MWICQLCGAWHVVPSLSRACEEKHLREVDVGPKVLDEPLKVMGRKASVRR